MRIPRPRSLAGQLFAMQVVLVAAVVAGCAVFTYVTAKGEAQEAARRQALTAATTIANSPAVVEAARSPDPTAVLQPYAERVRLDSGVAFVTIMNPRGVRWTHPEPGRIGEKFLGHTGPALRGEVFSETYTGTLGPSVRVVAPVREGGGTDGPGPVVALVSAGITIKEITEQERRQVLALTGVALAALVLGGLGTYVINARLRRHTHGMNANELSQMHDYHQATLQAVREGLVMLDGQRRIALINDGGRELLGLPRPDTAATTGPSEAAPALDARGGRRGAPPVGRHVGELGLPPPLTAALLDPRPRVDELHLTADRVLIVNTAPVSSNGRRGSVVTLRDHTELQALSGELDSVRGFAEALRSQAHEAANRLHAVVSLIELGRADEAVEFATAELRLAQALTDQVVGAVAEPVLAALLLGKAAQASEHAVDFELTPDSHIDDGLLPASLPARDLVTILGNLVDNAIDAAGGQTAPSTRGGSGRRSGAPVDGRRGRVTVTVRARDDELTLRVGDNGPGVGPGAAEEIFQRGWSTKAVPGHGLGLAIVRQTVHRNGGTITLGRSPRGGAEFTVRLPLRGTDEAPVDAGPRPATPAPSTDGRTTDGPGTDGRTTDRRTTDGPGTGRAAAGDTAGGGPGSGPGDTTGGEPGGGVS
ncbi:sensor histidine kinase [Streptomyces sp. AC536]|uniref:sensor histidine kinase n=1 Tax=Streptomyces buecherae TaxID=2763006 RepID=UPI00164D37B7|nr:sensor histidine kinase [Streptomyces buecherae]MBC3984348.1 sensor histidine kinase [Streptomyces buecherae]QNJ39962.1 sensor histidine kinase [Streptomyces buecherae]